MAAAVTREILITYGALAVSSIAAGTGAYTLSATPPAWIVAGGWITFYNCSNGANNGTFVISTVVGNVVTVVNASSVVETSGGLAAFPIAGPSNFSHHDKYKFRNSYKTRTYTFDMVFVGGTSYANFLLHCQQAEAAYRTPRQRFRVSFSGTVFDDLNPAAASGGNTGFNQDATIEKLGEDFDTSRSRGWRITVEAQLPADLAGQSGRQDSSVRVDFDPARRRKIAISGRYTAIGANDGRAQYNASIATYAAAIQASVAAGATFELVRESATSDDADKNLDFEQEYEELIYDQSSGTRDNSAIKQGRYAYSRQQIAPGDSDPGTRRLEIIDIDFECWIDKTVTTDLAGFWQSTLKTYLITEARSKFSLGQIALTDHQHRVDYSQNRIFGRMQIQATSSGGANLIQSRYTTKVETDIGKVFRGTWDGNIFSHHVYDGKVKQIRTRTFTKLLLGGAGAGGGSSGGSSGAAIGGSFGGGVVAGGSVSFSFMNGFSIGAFGGPYTGASQTALVQAAMSDGPPPGGEEAGGGGGGGLSGWVPIGDMVTITPITIGSDGYQIECSEVERVLIDRYVEAPKGGGGGGGAGPGAVGT